MLRPYHLTQLARTTITRLFTATRPPTPTLRNFHTTPHHLIMPNAPDLELYPSATGAALKFASAHSDVKDAPFTLYGSWFCPFVQRVWIVLHLKSIPHKYVEINPYHKAADFLARNPRGLVPTLAVNDPHYTDAEKSTPNGTGGGADGAATSMNEAILYESTIITQYLDALFPSPPNPLLSPHPYTRAHQQLHIDWISTKIVPSFYRFLQHTPSKSSSYTLSSARDEFVDRLKTLIRAMHPVGPWFGGSDISMVDVQLIPWAERVFLLDHYKGGSGVGEEKKEGDRELWERWWTWGEAVSGCESVKATMSDRDRYIEAYQRYAEDTAGSEVAEATRQGRGLP